MQSTNLKAKRNGFLALYKKIYIVYKYKRIGILSEQGIYR